MPQSSSTSGIIGCDRIWCEWRRAGGQCYGAVKSRSPVADPAPAATSSPWPNLIACFSCVTRSSSRARSRRKNKGID